MDNDWLKKFDSENAEIEKKLSPLCWELPELKKIKLTLLYDELMKLLHLSGIKRVSAEINTLPFFRIELRKIMNFFESPMLRFFKGMGLYMLFHEMGESSSYVSFTNLLLEISKKHEDKEKGNEQTEATDTLSLSKLTHSDLMGDLLSSALSPLSVDEQLSLLEHIETGKHFKPMRKAGSLEKGFVSAQKKTLKLYLTRERDNNYSTGKELFLFYKDILTMQKGFSEIQRIKFYTSLFGALQKSISDSMRELGEQGLLELLGKILNNPSDMDIKDFQRLTFNYALIKKYLNVS